MHYPTKKLTIGCQLSSTCTLDQMACVADRFLQEINTSASVQRRRRSRRPLKGLDACISSPARHRWVSAFHPAHQRRPSCRSAASDYAEGRPFIGCSVAALVFQPAYVLQADVSLFDDADHAVHSQPRQFPANSFYGHSQEIGDVGTG